jgi:hypothetical protein
MLNISNFNKTKNKDSYREIIRTMDHLKCRNCNDVIYYYDSTFKISKNELTTKGKSFESKKIVNNIVYKLSICEDCLTIKYPEYQNKNKSRVFNHLNDITCYAFDIPEEESDKWRKNNYAITKENLIKKYGDEIGTEKWNNYCNKQSYTNTFEYKNEKYGWTIDDFNEYNKSRSITLENLINKHGENKGLEIWNNYIEKQRYSTTIEYFINKYGELEGTEKFNSFCEKRLLGCGYSNVSKKLFDSLSEHLSDYTLYYADNEWFEYDKGNKKYYLIDFYIKELNIAIEFNGDMWHANPNKYKENDIPIPFVENLTSGDIWKKDELKNSFLRKKLKKLIIIWESDFNKNGIDKSVYILLKEINI